MIVVLGQDVLRQCLSFIVLRGGQMHFATRSVALITVFGQSAASLFYPLLLSSLAAGCENALLLAGIPGDDCGFLSSCLICLVVQF